MTLYTFSNLCALFVQTVEDESFLFFTGTAEGLDPLTTETSREETERERTRASHEVTLFLELKGLESEWCNPSYKLELGCSTLAPSP